MSAKSAQLIALLLILAACAAVVALNRPPATLPASAPPTDFSAERATSWLREIAQKPHSLGSPEHARVRDYLVGALTQLGVAPQIQRATGVTAKFQTAGDVENIVARLTGTNGRSDAILLAAHYDSVPSGPGAGDDGAGVVSLLETLRALNSGPPLRNDVIFLITDGEEEGLLGASAFMDSHPWARDVRVVLNFDNRGAGGVSQLFETSAGNGFLVRKLAAAAPHLSGSSLTYDIYTHLPNDTDITVFKRNGAGALNFAFIGKWEAYHTPFDNLQELDSGSIQQEGSYALAMVRRFGNADLPLPQERDAVFFGLPAGLFLHYSQRWVWPLVGLAAILLIGNAAAAWRTGRLLAGQTILSLIIVSGFALISAAGAFGIVRLLDWLHTGWLPGGAVVFSGAYALALITLLIAAWAGIEQWRQSHGRSLPESRVLAAQLFLLVASIASALWLKGGSYVFVWPLFSSLCLSLFVWKKDAAEGTRARDAAWIFLLALPPILIFVPMLQMFFLALGMTAMGAPAIALVLACFLAAVALQLQTFLATIGGKFAISALGISLLLFAVGAVETRYSTALPKATMVYYALDADTGKALWASTADRNDAWSVQFLGKSPRRAKLAGFAPDWLSWKLLQQDAPAAPLAPPEVTVLEQSSSTDSRTLRLLVRSVRGARELELRSPESEILEASLNGQPLPLPAKTRWNPSGRWSLAYYNAPADGAELRLRVKGTGPAKLVFIDHSPGLPSLPGVTVTPRPPDQMQIHSGDQTLVRRSFVF